MDSTLKVARWVEPVFKVTRFPRPVLKEPYFIDSCRMKKDMMLSRPKLYRMEEEKASTIDANKENFSYNEPDFRELQKILKSEKSKYKYFNRKSEFENQEREVKLADVEIEIQDSSKDQYNDERVAIEDEYGLPKFDMFQIQETEQFESQSVVHEQEQNSINSQVVDRSNGPVEENVDEGNCNGLKKGIDNDAIIADMTTMDGLSVFEDIIEGTQKKQWEDEDLENIDIFFADSHPRSEANDNLTHFEWSQSKGFEEDLEEEKVQKSVGKISSENFPKSVDFREEDADMEVEALMYNSQFFEESVPLLKKNSYREERGFSLFEEKPLMFPEEFSLNSKISGLRNRSMSKLTSDDWYGKDWRNHHFQNDYCPTFKPEDHEGMEVDEPEYFKQFDKVLNSKVIEDPINYSEIKNVNEQVEVIQNSADGEFKQQYNYFSQEIKEPSDCGMYQIEENSPLVGTIESQNFSPMIDKNNEPREELFPESNCF